MRQICLHRLIVKVRRRRLVQHRPEKAFLKERDDLADTVLHSYMRNTSDVLRMIEVRQKPTAMAMSLQPHMRSIRCKDVVEAQSRPLRRLSQQ